MKERILSLIKSLKDGGYDQEIAHAEYDKLLEDFILRFDANLLPLMHELIALEKEFWYA
jgi:hypothetical protein